MPDGDEAVSRDGMYVSSSICLRSTFRVPRTEALAGPGLVLSVFWLFCGLFGEPECISSA